MTARVEIMPQLTRVIYLIYALAYHTGLIRLCYWLNRNRVRVLTYHNILPDRLFDFSPHLGVSHSVSVFREHLRLINGRFQTSVWPAKSGSCVITFDDGYKNQWEIAGPILAEFDVSAVYFIPFKPIEDRRCLIIDDILKWISYAPSGDYNIFGQQLTLAPASRSTAFRKLYADLLRNPDRWNLIWAELNRASAFADLRIDDELQRLRFTPLHVDELAEMRATGHQIGCHSWEHFPLASLQPPALARDFELCACKVGAYANTRLYSYPFGSRLEEVSSEVAIQCSDKGFQCAFLNTNAIPGLTCRPEYALPRMSLPNTTDRYLLEAKLSGFEAALKRMLGR